MSDSEENNQHMREGEEIEIVDEDREIFMPMKPYSKKLQSMREDLLKKMERSRLLQHFLASEENAKM